jgi:hypothetical protein
VVSGPPHRPTEALRQTLLRLLKIRFGSVPRAVQKVVKATDDIDRLQGWCDRVVTAATLQNVGIVEPDEE